MSRPPPPPSNPPTPATQQPVYQQTNGQYEEDMGYKWVHLYLFCAVMLFAITGMEGLLCLSA